MDLVEQHEQTRDRLLSWMLAGFTAWWGMTVLGSIFEDWGEPAFAPLVLSTIGACAFGYAIYRLWQFQGVLQSKPEVARVLDDELSRQLRLESYAHAFWMMLITAGLYLILAGLIPGTVKDLLSGRSMAGLIVLLGVDAALLNFILRSREAARE